MAINIPIISEFDGQGVSKAIKQFKQLETTSEKAQFAIKKAAIPAAAALGGLAVALGDATKAAMEDQQEQAALALTLQNVTGAGAKQTAQIENQISAMSRASGIADTEYRKSLEALVRGTKDVDLAMRDMNLVMDISTALQMDSTTVADALAKAYQGNFKALRSLSPEMAIMIKEGATLEQVMDVLGGTFGGAVAKNAETAAGKMAIFKNSIAETKEGIGAAFLPVLQKVLPFMQRFADWAQNNPQAFTRIALTIGAIAAAVVALNIALATNPFILATAAVIGLAVAFNKLVDAMSAINSIGGLAARILGGLAMPVIGNVANIIGGLPDLAKLVPSAAEPPRPAAGRMGIPRFGDGGIVTSATLALVGEKGPEAIVPLDRMNMNQTPTNITVNVQGADPQQVVNALERYVRQNGALPGALL
tara:strand:- start:54 stop:1316 length:1263 start_codon:yes stop_codon:yes gene_type:complete